MGARVGVIKTRLKFIFSFVFCLKPSSTQQYDFRNFVGTQTLNPKLCQIPFLVALGSGLRTPGSAEWLGFGVYGQWLVHEMK